MSGRRSLFRAHAVEVCRVKAKLLIHSTQTLCASCEDKAERCEAKTLIPLTQTLCASYEDEVEGCKALFIAKEENQARELATAREDFSNREAELEGQVKSIQGSIVQARREMGSLQMENEKLKALDLQARDNGKQDKANSEKLHRDSENLADLEIKLFEEVQMAKDQTERLQKDNERLADVLEKMRVELTRAREHEEIILKDHERLADLLMKVERDLTQAKEHGEKTEKEKKILADVLEKIVGASTHHEKIGIETGLLGNEVEVEILKEEIPAHKRADVMQSDSEALRSELPRSRKEKGHKEKLRDDGADDLKYGREEGRSEENGAHGDAMRRELENVREHAERVQSDNEMLREVVRKLREDAVQSKEEMRRLETESGRLETMVCLKEAPCADGWDTTELGGSERCDSKTRQQGGVGVKGEGRIVPQDTYALGAFSGCVCPRCGYAEFGGALSDLGSSVSVQDRNFLRELRIKELQVAYMTEELVKAPTHAQLEALKKRNKELALKLAAERRKTVDSANHRHTRNVRSTVSELPDRGEEGAWDGSWSDVIGAVEVTRARQVLSDSRDVGVDDFREEEDGRRSKEIDEVSVEGILGQEEGRKENDGAVIWGAKRQG